MRWTLTLTLTYDLDFQSQPSYGLDPYTQNVKFKGQSVQKLEWKQMNGRTKATDCFNTVGNEPLVTYF